MTSQLFQGASGNGNANTDGWDDGWGNEWNDNNTQVIAQEQTKWAPNNNNMSPQNYNYPGFQQQQPLQQPPHQQYQQPQQPQFFNPSGINNYPQHPQQQQQHVQPQPNNFNWNQHANYPSTNANETNENNQPGVSQPVVNNVAVNSFLFDNGQSQAPAQPVNDLYGAAKLPNVQMPMKPNPAVARILKNDTLSPQWSTESQATSEQSNESDMLSSATGTSDEGVYYQQQAVERPVQNVVQNVQTVSETTNMVHQNSTAPPDPNMDKLDQALYAMNVLQPDANQNTSPAFNPFNTQTQAFGQPIPARTSPKGSSAPNNFGAPPNQDQASLLPLPGNQPNFNQSVKLPSHTPSPPPSSVQSSVNPVNLPAAGLNPPKLLTTPPLGPPPTMSSPMTTNGPPAGTAPPPLFKSGASGSNPYKRSGLATRQNLSFQPPTTNKQSSIAPTQFYQGQSNVQPASAPSQQLDATPSQNLQPQQGGGYQNFQQSQPPAPIQDNSSNYNQEYQNYYATQPQTQQPVQENYYQQTQPTFETNTAEVTPAEEAQNYFQKFQTQQVAYENQQAPLDVETQNVENLEKPSDATVTGFNEQNLTLELQQQTQWSNQPTQIPFQQVQTPPQQVYQSEPTMSQVSPGAVNPITEVKQTVVINESPSRNVQNTNTLNAVQYSPAEQVRKRIDSDGRTSNVSDVSWGNFGDSPRASPKAPVLQPAPVQPIVQTQRPPIDIETNQEIVPNNDRNEYLQTGHLSEENYNRPGNSSVETVDNLPPPGLSRYVPGQLENEPNTINRSLEPPPGLDRMVPGTDLSDSTQLREADGQASDMPPVTRRSNRSRGRNISDRSLYTVPGDSGAGTQQQQQQQRPSVPGDEDGNRTPQISTSVVDPIVNVQEREIAADGENLQDQLPTDLTREVPLEGADTFDEGLASTRAETESVLTLETGKKETSTNDDSDRERRAYRARKSEDARKVQKSKKGGYGSDESDYSDRNERYKREGSVRNLREGSVKRDRDLPSGRSKNSKDERSGRENRDRRYKESGRDVKKSDSYRDKYESEDYDADRRAHGRKKKDEREYYDEEFDRLEDERRHNRHRDKDGRGRDDDYGRSGEKDRRHRKYKDERDREDRRKRDPREKGDRRRDRDRDSKRYEDYEYQRGAGTRSERSNREDRRYAANYYQQPGKISFTQFKFSIFKYFLYSRLFLRRIRLLPTKSAIFRAT